jgi:hypothetical protein
MTDHKLHHNSTHYEVNVWLNYDGPNNILIYRTRYELFGKLLHTDLPNKKVLIDEQNTGDFHPL